MTLRETHPNSNVWNKCHLKKLWSVPADETAFVRLNTGDGRIQNVQAAQISLAHECLRRFSTVCVVMSYDTYDRSSLRRGEN